MRNIIIFGGTGPVGRELINEFSILDRVYVISRSKPHIESAIWLECNLLDEIPFNVFPNNIDQIIYLAQYDNYRDFPDNSMDLFRVNVECFMKVLGYAYRNKISKVLYASSGGIYGNGSNPFVEQDWLKENNYGWLGNKNPINFYYKTKAIAEIIADSYTKFLDITILRFFFIYGFAQKKTMLIPKLIEKIHEGQTIYLDGEKGITINPIHAVDVSKAIIHCLKNSVAGSYNVAGSENLTIYEISEIIGQIISKKPIYQKTSDSNTNILVGDTEKIRSTGWVPNIKFEEGIKGIINSMCIPLRCVE